METEQLRFLFALSRLVRGLFAWRKPPSGRASRGPTIPVWSLGKYFGSGLIPVGIFPGTFKKKVPFNLV